MPLLKATTLAKWEQKIRPVVTRLPSPLATAIYSFGRTHFLKKLHKDVPIVKFVPPENLSRTLWGLEFRSPIMNAAGIYKNGECYDVCIAQGAGGFLGGTTTALPRKGNKKGIIRWPFAPFPRSKAAANWLGLPNKGHKAVAKTVATFKKTPGVPVGWSLMGAPELEGEEKLQKLVEGLKAFEAAGVDFLEINESCPNTEEGKPQESGMAERLTYISENFLNARNRSLPVIVKFSTDTEQNQVPELIDLLVRLGFDGVNFGNTSTQYSKHREYIHPKERKLYDYFTQKFGGGISGEPLKKDSLALATLAVEHINSHKPSHEFHVIRTGGIETWADIEASEKAGISLNQWYTGYFEQFAQNGHDIYHNMFEKA
ncbi:MAG: hypothetical protein R3B71_03030 [Candidatus Gracilibacteria bacterium]